MSNFDRVLLNVEVRETDRNRSYWANRPSASKSAHDIRRAELLIVPWENFREEYPAVFPQETLDLVNNFRAATQLSIVVGIDREYFQEISLHGRAWRWPTLFATSVVLPIVVGVLTNRVDELIVDGGHDDTLEMELIIEREFGPCIAIKYKGPPGRLIETLVQESTRCLPIEQSPDAKETDEELLGG